MPLLPKNSPGQKRARQAMSRTTPVPASVTMESARRTQNTNLVQENCISESIAKNKNITPADKLAEMNPKMPKAKLTRSARMYERGSSSQRGGPRSNNQFIGFLVKPLT